ncbi:MAG: NrfD/PsrC family molybdoenzyme membrane anchor subunit [Vicinamibacterales bacterium]
MGTPADARARGLIGPQQTVTTVTEQVSGYVLDRPVTWGWLAATGAAFLLVMLFLVAVTYLFMRGVGIWGIGIPVAWGFAIINFVWWIGIGHAGTLISAILLLLNQGWRTSINRFAEAMTLFAVACAAVFPVLHLGRPWFFYWLFPYPATTNVWPQFRSPLIWDLFAVTTYGLVSLLFWYVGLLPDLATMRDRAKSWFGRVAYGALALGWTGSARHWARYEMLYLLLAGLATPLVVSVHSVVALDFAISLVPGWHTTDFPPYFVAGAIYSGFSMVLSLLIPIRAIYGLQDFVTRRHLDVMAKVMLTTGLFVAYGYAAEIFYAWYSGNQYEMYQVLNRVSGPYALAYYALMLTNVIIPQALWLERVRANTVLLWLVAMAINAGMWLERFVIVVVSLNRDYLVSSWALYVPTFWDWATLAGTIGLFLSLLFLFIRLLPMMSMAELRQMVPVTSPGPGPEGRGKVSR